MRVDSVTQAHFTASTSSPRTAATESRAGEWPPLIGRRLPCAACLASPPRCGNAGLQPHARPRARACYVHPAGSSPLDAPGHDDIANIGFIVGSRCVAVIDTGGSVRIGRAVARRHPATHALPICYVINTHVHVDHVLGNVAFKDERASFVGHATLAQAIARSRPYFVKEYARDLDAPATPEQVIGPDRLVETELTLDLGDQILDAARVADRAHRLRSHGVRSRRAGPCGRAICCFVERLPALDGSLKGWLAALDGSADEGQACGAGSWPPHARLDVGDRARNAAICKPWQTGCARARRLARSLQDALDAGRLAEKSALAAVGQGSSAQCGARL